MRIIFDNGSGGCGILHPVPKFMATLSGTETEKLTYIANKDLPPGTKFEIVADADVDKDKIGDRDTWQYVSGANELIAEAL